MDKSTVIRVSRHFTVCKCFLPAGRKDVQIKKGQLSGILLKKSLPLVVKMDMMTEEDLGGGHKSSFVVMVFVYHINLLWVIRLHHQVDPVPCLCNRPANDVCATCGFL